MRLLCAVINRIGGDGEIRTLVPVKANAFRVLSPSVTYMVSPVSFSQPCTPANPHKIWTFLKKRPKIRRNRPSVPISDFSAFGKNCGKNGKNKNEKAIHGQFECRQSLSRYEVYCHERTRNQLGRRSRCDHEGSAVSHLPYQQIHRPVPATKRENPLRVHGQKNTLLQNQERGCHCLSGKPQGVPRKLLRPGGLVQGRLHCPDGGTGSPNRAGAFAAILYRAALLLS